MKKKMLLIGFIVIGLLIMCENAVYAACTKCNSGDHTGCTGTYKCEYLNSTQHRWRCCCGSKIFYATNHKGGSATCTSGAKCSECGSTYGSSLGHTGGSWKSEGYGTGKRHYKVCTRCSSNYNYGNHSYGSWSKYNDSTHRRSCTTSGCPSYGSDSHSGSASCTSAAYCSTCSSSWGSATGHTSNGLWYGNGAGTQHYTKCSTCGTNFDHADHWNSAAATCTTGKYCNKCSEYYGSALGHSPGAAATCTSAQTCTRCGTTLANALGHTGGTATCTSAQICTRCGGSYGSALGHSPGAAATCTTPQTCTRCGTTLANALEHTGGTATCTSAKTCTRCGASYGSSLGHVPGTAATCTTAQKCTRTGCGATLQAALGHIPGAAATCTTAQKCTRSGCGATLQAAKGHSRTACPTCNTSNIVCTVCGDVASHTCDNTPPTVSAADITYGTVISATLKDTQSGVSYWQVTNSTSTPTSNWISITNTKETTVSESSARNVGTYYVWVKDAAGYTAYDAVTVSAKNISGLTASLSPTSYVYNGTARNPSVTLKDGSTTLTNGTHYTVAYSNNTNVGTGKVTITGKGNYTGSKELTFSITVATPGISLVDKSATYTGSPISINAATVSGVSGGTTPSGAITYTYYTNSGCTTKTSTTNGATASGGAPAKAGTYYVKATIAAAGNYASATSAAKTLTITSKDIAASGVTASLNTTTYVYNGTARTPGVTVKDGSTTLTNGTHYTVAYSSNTNVGTATVTITGKGDYSGSRQLTFSITVATPSISLTEKTATYTGSVINIGTASVSGVSGGTTPSGAVTYKYYINSACTTQTTTSNGATANGGAPKNVGTYYVKATIAAAGNYGSNTSSAVKLVINTKALSESDITVSLNQTSYVYDGTAKTPTPTVKYGSITLVSGTDYTVGYSNNVDVGTATVTVTGKGNYSGTKSVNFTITIATPTLTVSPSEYNISKGSVVTPTYSYNGNGSITASAANSSIATATPSTTESKLTVKAIGAGNTTVTVNSSATKQYTSASKSITIRVFDVANVSDVSTTVGKTASFTASLINSYSGSTYSYQWQQSTNGGSSWSSISGATSSTYSVAVSETMNGYQYRCVVKNNGGYSITSNTATLTCGWDISKNGDGSVIAYLKPSGSNYIMTVSGTGEMKDFADYELTPWYNYKSMISELIIKEGVKSIGDRAFYKFENIKTINFPSSLKSIGSFIFYRCTGITDETITIPKSVEYIGSNPFIYVPVKNYVVETGNTKYKAVDGVLFNANGTTLISYPAGAIATSYEVPNGVTLIGTYAFSAARFTSIKLPSTVVELNMHAFESSKITSITLPESVRLIHANVFENATALSEIFVESLTLDLVGANSFDNIKSGSIIYTLSKDIANKFVAGTNYVAANTDVYYPPTITKHPADVKSIWGRTATFNVEIEEGNPNASYQWYKNGVAISGATSSSYTTPALTAADDGATFYCLVYNAEWYRNKDMVKSNVANLIAIDGRYSIIRNGEELFYDSLQLVLDNVLDGETIDVRKNIAAESDAILTGNKNIVFNTNNYFVTLENGANFEISNGSKVTLIGTGTIKKTVDDSTSLITNNGMLEVTGSVKMNNVYGYTLENTGIATLINGEYRGAMPIHVSGAATSKVTINGENIKIIAEGNMMPEHGAITVEGNSKLEFVKGTVTASAAISEVRGILVKENASADVLDGKITTISSNATNQGDAIGVKTTGFVNVSGDTILDGSRAGIALLEGNTGDVNITGGTIIGGQIGIFNNSNATVSVGNSMDELVETTVPVIRGEEIAYVSLKANSKLAFYDGVLQSAGGKNVIYQDVIAVSSNVITDQNIAQIENDVTNTHKLHFADGTIEPTYPLGYDIHLVTQQIEGKTYDIGYLRLYTAPIVNGPRNMTIKLGETAIFQVTAVGGVPSKYTYRWQLSVDNGRNWTDISDSDSATYETPIARQEMDSNMYRCIVSNGIFNVESREVMLTIDQESLMELPIDIVPIGTYTFIKGNTVSEVNDREAVELEFVVKSTSPLRKLVMNDTTINLTTDADQIISNATIRKTNYVEIKNATGEIAEYAYSFYMVVNKNGIYTATFEDEKGHSNIATQTVDTFKETPLTIEYTVEEPTLYREYAVIIFMANRDVKFVEPESFKTQMIKQGDGEYVRKYTLDVYSELTDVIFTFADKSGYTADVTVSTNKVINKNVRLTSDSNALGSISINDAYNNAQTLEEKVEKGVNGTVQFRYGVSNTQVDMFMSRARDIGAAVILSNATSAKSYDVSLPKDIEGGNSSKLSRYGLSGINNEYVAAFNAYATGTDMSKADSKYVDILKGSRLNLYKGLTINGFSMSSSSQPYAIMNGENSGSNVADTATNGNSFRVTIINK